MVTPWYDEPGNRGFLVLTDEERTALYAARPDLAARAERLATASERAAVVARIEG